MSDITYVADISGDIDDLIAIEYLHNQGRLDSVVLDGASRDADREDYLKKLGIKINELPKTPIIFCGGAFTKIAEWHQEGFPISLVVLNGFFAGENIVPAEHVLPKFEGRLTCSSYNPNLDPKAALYITQHCDILAVSKNVCHHSDNVINKWHGNHNCKPTKKLHDLLMSKEGLNHLDNKPMLCEYKEVEIFRRNGEWGCFESPKSNIKISIFYK